MKTLLILLAVTFHYFDENGDIWQTRTASACMLSAKKYNTECWEWDNGEIWILIGKDSTKWQENTNQAKGK